LNLFRPGFKLNTTLPRKKHYDAQIPENNALQDIFFAIKGTNVELPVTLAIWLGMRMSEIRGLMWEDLKDNVLHIQRAMVDVDKNTAIKQPKSYAGNRKITLDPILVDLINKQPETSKYIITMSGQAISKRFYRICEKAGIPHCRFHDLRHANASVMLSLGIPDKYAMERIGDSTTSMYKNVYQHTLSDNRKIVDIKVNNYFTGIFCKKKDDILQVDDTPHDTAVK
jgi:integrase